MNQTVDLGGTMLRALVARTVDEKEKGLQGITSLPLNTCMLFPYGDAGVRDFHMGEVSFPIDIVFCEGGYVVIFGQCRHRHRDKRRHMRVP
jgi:uncharacterized membrane protein (UPF0127 family)